MNEKKLKGKASEFFNAIPGFTMRLEKQLATTKANKKDVNLTTITSMPTYSFAICALENDSPLQVIKVMEEMKKRYRFSADNEVLGFLDSIEGKAYGYIALNIKNIELKHNFYKLACKCFKNAISRGYEDAVLDLADLEAKIKDAYAAEEIVLKSVEKTKESFTKLGDLFYGFDMLVENAIRVLENKRPIIEDDLAFWYALCKYKEGSKDSINCKLYYGLALIVYNHEGSKDEGLKLVKESFEEFKKENKNTSKILFSTDAKNFDNTLKTLEEKIIKINRR